MYRNPLWIIPVLAIISMAGAHAAKSDEKVLTLDLKGCQELEGAKSGVNPLDQGRSELAVRAFSQGEIQPTLRVSGGATNLRQVELDYQDKKFNFASSALNLLKDRSIWSQTLNSPVQQDGYFNRRFIYEEKTSSDSEPVRIFGLVTSAVGTDDYGNPVSLQQSNLQHVLDKAIVNKDDVSRLNLYLFSSANDYIEMLVDVKMDGKHRFRQSKGETLAVQYAVTGACGKAFGYSDQLEAAGGAPVWHPVAADLQSQSFFNAYLNGLI